MKYKNKYDRFFINLICPQKCLAFWGHIIKYSYYKKFGAEDEIRTRDVHLGKVTLYHWATPAFFHNQ